MYKLASLFDGSGGFPLAGTLCGIRPVWASEVEPYPIAVTRERFPGMTHKGDISKINGAEVEPVDIITFGSPCQDLSVAGKRAGLKHTDNGDEETTRSGLFMEAVRIIKEMRAATNGEYPRFALWENVPGAFSSNKGEDFRTVLEELIRIVEPDAVMPPVPSGGWAYADSYSGDGWSLAYRVFDAQYWGVPQRRRRIHLVVDFTGQCAGQVLFEREGVRGYFAEGRTPWQATAGNAAGSPGADDRAGEGFDGYNGYLLPDDQRGQQINVRTDGKAPTLRAETHGNLPCVLEAAGFKAGQGAQARSIGWENEKCPTLAAEAGGNSVPSVCIKECLPFDTTQVTSPQNGCNPKWGDPCHPLAAHGHPPTVIHKCYDARGNGDGDTVSTITGDHENRITDYTTVICLQGNGIDRADTAGCNGKGWKEDTSYTLNTIDRPAVVYCTDIGFFNSQEEVAPTLLDRSYKDPHTVSYPENAVQYIVRRLTPTECARLQGFPDDWGHPDHKEDFTDEEYRFWLNVRNTHAAINGKAIKDYTEEQMLTWYNKLHTDSAEYKMWGNGIALPPALYCMQGIVDSMGREEEQHENR